MRKQLQLVFPFLFVIYQLGFSQSAPHAACAQESYLQSLDQVTQQTYSSVYQQALENNTQSHTRDFEIYQIPVVVHVVYTNEDENISQERIEQQIKLINQDFRRTNIDADKVRPIFENVVGDPGIEFQLVKTIRVKTDTSFSLNFDISTLTYQMPDHVKSSAYGGSDPFDTREFLNIWVCPIAGDLIYGYAYPPIDAGNWPAGSAAPHIDLDGIVINYKTFGAPPPVFHIEGERIELEGRTLTHELGHYLGLRHPWGDSELGLYQCFLDDGLDDTPTMKEPSFNSCDHEKNTCGSITNDLPDMIENFMDFSSQNCQNSFTLQQIDIMRQVLARHRGVLRVKTQQLSTGTTALVYPNPSSGFVKIILEEDNDVDYQIVVRNLLGHSFSVPIYYHEDAARNYRIDLSALSDGVYFIEFAAERRCFTERVILSRE